jgi:ADP-ribose pyrophosphatase YjhB (NUDIX family)
MQTAMRLTDYDTRLAAYAVIVQGDEVLLSWYNGQGRGEPGWSLPGGGVDFDESCEEGAIREIWEETGYVAELLDPLTVHSWTLRADPLDPLRPPFKSLRVIYEGRVVDGTLGTIEVGGSTDEARWLALAEVVSLPRADIVDVGINAWMRRHGRQH